MTAVRRQVLAIAVAALGLAGCGAAAQSSPAGAVAAATAPDPCSLISAAELASVLGAPAGPGIRQQMGDYTGCAWTVDSGAPPQGEPVTVGIAVDALSRYEGVASAAAASAIPSATVPGLADGAVFDLGGSVPELHLRRGSVALVIMVTHPGAGAATLERQDVDVARAVLGHIAAGGGGGSAAGGGGW